jgi:hypothetical protein
VEDGGTSEARIEGWIEDLAHRHQWVNCSDRDCAVRIEMTQDEIIVGEERKDPQGEQDVLRRTAVRAGKYRNSDLRQLKDVRQDEDRDVASSLICGMSSKSPKHKIICTTS